MSSCLGSYGNCVLPAAPAVDDGCETDLSTSSSHCGDCDRACSSAQVAELGCTGGLCTSSCRGSWGNCVLPAAPAVDDGCETDLSTSSSHCGDCGRACSSAQVAELGCTGGLCTSSCTGSWGNCNQPAAPAADDGCETDLGGEPSHCGDCGRACSSAQVAELACTGGLCTSSCTGSRGNCNQPAAPAADDGCETDLDTSVDHCGGCGNSCYGDAVEQADCVDGACVIIQCAPGYDDCDGEPSNGCETDLDSDVDHCGACDRACSSAGVDLLSCTDGLCDSSCTGLLGNCLQPEAPAADDGCETDLSVDCLPCGCVTETFGENTGDTYQGVTQDTFLDANNPNDNYGASVELIIDGQPRARTLIQFDLTSIEGGTIIEAVLHVFLSDGAANPGSNNTSQLYPVLLPWTEGSRAGRSGTPNWDFVEPAVDWGPSGAGAPDAVAVGSVTPTGGANAERVVSIDRATVQAWVDGSLQNNGLVIINDGGNDGAYLHSSESDNGRRPFFELLYVP
jgi:hypothetical protein